MQPRVKIYYMIKILGSSNEWMTHTCNTRQCGCNEAIMITFTLCLSQDYPDGT